MSVIGYLALFGAVVATWLAISGPGEAALVSAGALAAKGRIDVASVLAVAFAGTLAGGVAGYWIGRLGGRRLVVRPGPLLERRRRALEKAESLVRRSPFLASLLSPGWLSGIHAISPRTYVAATSLSGLAWTLSVGLGAFFVGPSAVDVLHEAGRYGALAAVAVGAPVAAFVLVRRRRGRAGGPAA